MTTVKEAIKQLTQLPADEHIVVQVITFDDLEWKHYPVSKQELSKYWSEWSTEFQVRTKWPLIRELQEWLDIYAECENERQHNLVDKALKKMGVE